MTRLLLRLSALLALLGVILASCAGDSATEPEAPVAAVAESAAAAGYDPDGEDLRVLLFWGRCTGRAS